MKKRILIIFSFIVVFILGLIGGFVFNNMKAENTNIKELMEDVNSIINDGTIINAKEKEPSSTPSTYYGKGYNITVALDSNSTEYFIYLNNEEVWHYTKTQDQEVTGDNTEIPINGDFDNFDIYETSKMENKLSGLWYNKDQNLYFRISDNNYQSGEFATDAVINCEIESIKLLNSGKYRLRANNCIFDGDKRDNELFEFTYNDSDNIILKNGNQYKLTDENELYNN